MKEDKQKSITKIKKMIENAIELQKKENLNEAETIYQEVLTIDKNNHDALHLLGIVNYQKKNYQN